MGLQDLSNCVAAYHLEPAGVVGGQLIDQSGYGNHLDLIFGTPLYATRDGIEMMDFDNSFWFEGRNVMLSGGSVAVVGCLSMAGSEGVLYPVNTVSIKTTAGNFNALPYENTDAEWFSSTYQIKGVGFSQSRAVTLNDRTGVATPGAVWTNDQANLFVGCFDIATQTAIGARGSDTPTSNAVASGITAARDGALIRIGHIRSSGSFLTGRYVSAKRLYFFADNVFNHPSFATERAAEIAAWGI